MMYQRKNPRFFLYVDFNWTSSLTVMCIIVKIRQNLSETVSWESKYVQKLKKEVKI